jgi:hypothetical protein
LFFDSLKGFLQEEKMDAITILHYRSCIIGDLDVYFEYRNAFAMTGNLFDYDETRSWKYHIMFMIDMFFSHFNKDSHIYKMYIEKKKDFTTLVEWFVQEHYDFSIKW